LLKLGNSILANSISQTGGGFECARDPQLSSNPVWPTAPNLIEDGSCQVTAAISGDPMLGAETGQPGSFPLLPGSPAIDAGANFQCAGVDQRGATRPKDGNGDDVATCDLGAHEAP
jgi:hypothetical protein